MELFKRSRRWLSAIAVILMLTVTTSCSSVSAPEKTTYLPGAGQSTYGQLERGNSAAGQNFGDWVVSTSQGLVKDAFVRDNDKLGVVISSDVRPNEVRDLTRSLLQGFHSSFPNKDLTVLTYAPDKELILTARYDSQSNQVKYNVPS